MTTEERISEVQEEIEIITETLIIFRDDLTNAERRALIEEREEMERELDEMTVDAGWPPARKRISYIPFSGAHVPERFGSKNVASLIKGHQDVLDWAVQAKLDDGKDKYFEELVRKFVALFL